MDREIQSKINSLEKEKLGFAEKITAAKTQHDKTVAEWKAWETKMLAK